MKATIETYEPTIRPAATVQRAASPRPARATASLTPVRTETALFHAWRA